MHRPFGTFSDSTSPATTTTTTTTTTTVGASGGMVVGVRTLRSNTTSIENEAMTIFRDLDKGLRSTSISQQCESIVRFSDLVLKYPLPSIINTALLCLAEFFRNCDNNFVRYWIVLVFNEVRGEFPKVLNKNELTKRISSVLVSNDPIARALTLRVLASMAAILSERIDLQQKIETSLLNCVDDVEREASMIAIEQICATSRRFAAHILPELEKFIKDLKTPLHAKLQLIRIFKHMHGTAAIAKKAFSTCVDLLQVYPAKDFVITILDTVTQLAYLTIVVAKETFALLFALLEKDMRKAVKIQCLKNIIILSRKLSGSYTLSFPSQVLYQILAESPFETLKLQTLKLLSTLSASPFMIDNWFANNINLVNVCKNYLFHKSKQFVDESLVLLINIVRYTENYANPMINELNNLLSTSICLALNQRSEDKMLCESIVRYVKAFPSYSTNITMNIIQRIRHFVDKNNINAVKLLSLCLLKFTHKLETMELIIIFSDNLIELIHLLLQQGSEYQYSSTVRVLCVSLLRSYSKGVDNLEFIQKMQQIINKLHEVQWLWTLYEIAKEEASLSYHYLACNIFKEVSHSIENEMYYFWVNSLRNLCSAEYELLMFGKEGRKSHSYSLITAINFFNKVLVELRGCSTIVSSSFQVALVQLRREYAQLLQNIFLDIMNVNPISITAKQRFNQLSLEMASLGDSYRDLIFSYFDVDDRSYNVLSLIGLQCVILSYALRRLLGSDSSKQLMHFDENNEQYSGIPLYDYCVKATKMLQSVPDAFSQRVNILQEIIYLFLSCGCMVPRFYYQTYLNTRVQMEVEVNGKNVQKASSTFVTTVGCLLGQGLIMKFSGYIQQENIKRRDQRKVKAVCIHIKQRRDNTASDMLEEGENKQQQVEEQKTLTVKVVNYSFQIQSMSVFQQEGSYKVTITTQIIDENDKYWNTFAGERMIVNVTSRTIV